MNTELFSISSFAIWVRLENSTVKGLADFLVEHYDVLRKINEEESIEHKDTKAITSISDERNHWTKIFHRAH